MNAGDGITGDAKVGKKGDTAGIGGVPKELLQHPLSGFIGEFEQSSRGGRVMALTLRRKTNDGRPGDVVFKGDVSLVRAPGTKPPEPKCYPPTPEVIVPAIAPRPGMNRTWRKRRHDAPVTVVNAAYWDLCEIAQLLTRGFREQTDWGYWAVSQGKSWLEERSMYCIPPEAPESDRKIVEDLVRTANVIHLNELHNYWFLEHVTAGTRIVIHHHGCYHRDNPARYERSEVNAGYKRVVSTVDLLICGDPECDATKVWLPSPLDLNEMDRLFGVWAPLREGEKVTVGHCWTVGANKGSDEFARIAEHTEGFNSRFQLAIWHKVPRRQSWYYLSQCDVYFATFLYGAGLATYEAMALGIPAIVGFQQVTPGLTAGSVIARYREEIGSDELPFIVVTPETCGQWLRDLTHDSDLRAEWGRRGRAYVEKWHDLPVVTKRAQDIYEATEPCKFVVGA